MITMLKKEYATSAEAAAMLGVTQRTVGWMISRNKLPAELVGRTWVIPLAAIERLAGERAQSDDRRIKRP